MLNWKIPNLGLAAAALTVLAALSLPASAGAFCLDTPGDVDGNGVLNIIDVQCTQLVTLWSLTGGVDPLPECLPDGDPFRADLNCDEQTNVVDITIGIQYALGALNPSPDFDATACFPTCLDDVGGGACCDAEEAPGCEEPECESCVCDLDPFCCEASWDFICASEALADCPDECGCPGPSEGDCCGDHVAPGCGEVTCESCVCDADPFCCNNTWDDSCVGLASTECNDDCECVPAQTGECCAANDSAGCESAACNACVCSEDAACCDVVWDAACASAANDACIDDCGCGVIDDNCCTASDAPGCNDAECEAKVCEQDPFCCATVWDNACAETALECCPELCDGPSLCDGAAGNCCEENGSAGCDDFACCESVCATDSFCCMVTWDATCVDAALELCAPAACEPDVEPEPTLCEMSTGACTDAKDSGVGCEDAACCETVCEADAFCCEVVWDEVCAGEAMLLCDGMEPAACGSSDQSCCGVGEGAGCVDFDCCVSVCGADTYCCDVTWDAVCVNTAAEVCGDTCTQADDSCVGHCGGDAPAGCGCDSACVTAGDCCADACDACGFCPALLDP